LKKGGGLLGPFFQGIFKAIREAKKPWSPRSVVDPTVQPWQPGFAWLDRVLGSEHHGLPVVTQFSVVHPDGCLSFVPLHFCIRQSYPDRCHFRHVQPLLIEGEGTQSREWNLIECLQRPFRLSLRNPKNSLSANRYLIPKIICCKANKS